MWERLTCVTSTKQGWRLLCPRPIAGRRLANASPSRMRRPRDDASTRSGPSSPTECRRGRSTSKAMRACPRHRRRSQARAWPSERARCGLSPEEVGPVDSERFVRFVWRVAGRPDGAAVGWKRERLLVMVLDNYSVHKSARVQAEEAALVTAGVILWYLPAYTPEMSAIERIWQDVKYRRMQRRSHDQLRELKQAFDSALTEKAADLYAAHGQSDQLLRRAASHEGIPSRSADPRADKRSDLTWRRGYPSEAASSSLPAWFEGRIMSLPALRDVDEFWHSGRGCLEGTGSFR